MSRDGAARYLGQLGFSLPGAYRSYRTVLVDTVCAADAFTTLVSTGNITIRDAGNYCVIVLLFGYSSNPGPLLSAVSGRARETVSGTFTVILNSLLASAASFIVNIGGGPFVIGGLDDVPLSNNQIVNFAIDLEPGGDALTMLAGTQALVMLIRNPD